MKIVCLDSSKATVELSCDEAGALGNAINESLEALDAWEFPIRMGVEIDEAKALLAEIARLVDEMKRKK